jgi:hypothetical protein
MQNPVREENFWSKVDKSGDCWLWTGSKMKGYGHIGTGYRYEGTKTYLAHRISWNIHFGDIPEGMCVLHKCNNPSCVNPSHLYLGTQKDNANDREIGGRGHNRVGENNGCAKLNDSVVRLIKEWFIIGYSDSEISRKLKDGYWFDISRGAINNIRLNKSWTHI